MTAQVPASLSPDDPAALHPELDNYWVVGNPIAHSKSPVIHALFARQTGQNIHYRAVLVARDGFARALDYFAAHGGRGMNVTVPFKQEAWLRAQLRSERVMQAEAANTLWLDAEGRWCADNTDGIGLVRDLTVNLGWTLRDARILLLGAGGAASGVVGPLLDEKPAALVIANRTASRAAELARRFANLGPVRSCALQDLGTEAFDLIINATSMSLQGTAPDLPAALLRPGAACYDMMYGSEPTPFMRWGSMQGARTADGLGMLVEQAAESFRIWRGVRPETPPVMAALRQSLAAPARPKEA